MDGAPGVAVGLHDLSHGLLLLVEQEVAGSNHLAFRDCA